MNLDSKTISLAKGPNYAAFTTLFSDGIPQTHVMWVDTDGENLLKILKFIDINIKM